MTARVPGTRAGRKPQIYVGLPTIDDDAPTELKNQMALRATTWVEGRCPSCGAEPELTAYVELTSSVLSSSTHSTVPLPNCSTRASRKAQKPKRIDPIVSYTTPSPTHTVAHASSAWE